MSATGKRPRTNTNARRDAARREDGAEMAPSPEHAMQSHVHANGRARESEDQLQSLQHVRDLFIEMMDAYKAALQQLNAATPHVKTAMPAWSSELTALQAQAETIFAAAKGNAMLQTTGMKFVEALELAIGDRKDSSKLISCLRGMHDPINTEFIFTASDILQSTESGQSIAHAMLDLPDDDLLLRTLQAIVQVQLFKNNLKRSDPLDMQQMSQCKAKMLFKTHCNGIDLCFFSEIAVTGASQEQCVQILQLTQDYLWQDKNVHGHSLLGIAAAVLAQGKNCLMQALMQVCIDPNHTHEYVLLSWEPFWNHYCQDVDSALFTEVDVRGLTPFAYICMFGNPSYLKWVQRDVLRDACMKKSICLRRGQWQTKRAYPLPYSSKTLFEDIDDEQMQLNYDGCKFMYVHLAALARNEEMLEFLVVQCLGMDFMDAVACLKIEGGILDGASVATCLHLKSYLKWFKIRGQTQVAAPAEQASP